VIGFYISGHPLNHYQVEIKEFTDISTKNLRSVMEGQEVKIVGLIEHIKLTNTRRTHERMAIIKVEDMDGEVEVVIFPSDYLKLSQYLNEGEVVFLRGRVSFRDNLPKIIATDMKHVQDFYDSIKAINVDLSSVGQDGLKDLKEKLLNFPGKVPVYLHLHTKNYKSVQILVGDDLFVAPNENLMNDIKELVGKEKFSVAL